MEDMELTRRQFWRDRPTFVTGASGLVGGWLVERLLELNASVICLVRDWVSQSALLKSERFLGKTTLIRGDVRDYELLERVLGEYEIDTVFHLAAQTIVGVANRNPISTFETNIAGTWRLLEACRRSPKIKHVVIASSDKAYGEHTTLPYDEKTPLQGKHPYDVSKSCTDLLATAYAVTYDVPIAITRCGNFFGGGDLNWNRLIPGTIRSIAKDKRPLIRSDGSYIRDYFYVEDGVEAYILLAESLAKDSSIKGEAYNFSYEKEITALEMVEKILDLMGSDLKPIICNETSNEIYRQCLSAEKARSQLGWQPSYSVETGLVKTVNWYVNMFSKTKETGNEQ